MNSARLLVVSLLPSAVAAAQIGHVSPVSPSISIITLPLPPGPGLPLDPPSKNPTLYASPAQSFRAPPCFGPISD
ncbi:hypothetical protein PR003_g25341 [Phytophthora rubi]|uniref:RxLR effector protein n=1 Tax=Phytophthora rubi TaxID=129364 RepID=A0A6A3I6U0_9STRA|nr:hypothetical protein PR002_g25277 [Phytophthora rubi]KAE9290263.1 hypothetical protein PR003_g25341 [Phytophthora rubi]